MRRQPSEISGSTRSNGDRLELQLEGVNSNHTTVN